MNTLQKLLPYMEMALAALVIILVLLQQSSAGLGGAFGESNNFGTGYHTRRGFEKFIFNATIVVSILFALSALAALKI